MQRIIGFIKTRDIIHVRRADQSPVEPIRPRVIRTLNRGEMSASVFPQPGPAVTANIVKAAHRRLLSRTMIKLSLGDFRDEIIAGSCDLVLMPDQNPLPGKNLLLALLQKFRAKQNSVALSFSRQP